MAAAVLCTVAAGAQAQPCESDLPEAGVPVRAPLAPANFGEQPEACGVTSISLRGRLALLIAMDDYYGQMHAGVGLGGRLVLPGGSWLSAELPGFDYRFAANATIEAESMGLSASTVGYHVPVRLGDHLQLAPYGRLMFPTETVFDNALRYGVEHGISMVGNVAPWLEVMGGYSLPLALTTGAYGHSQSLFMPTVSLDIGLRPFTWFEGVGGLSMRVAPGEEEAFEGLDPRAALRFYPWRGSFIDVSGTFPLLGRDRTNAAVGVTLGVLFGTDGH
ncbi:MAG: hypothetical protein JRI68_17915 [Deltaproteobacteria bacterium]|nr:hypothetical protein [Deltaproteobacteria bacterium]